MNGTLLLMLRYYILLRIYGTHPTAHQMAVCKETLPLSCHAAMLPCQSWCFVDRFLNGVTIDT